MYRVNSYIKNGWVAKVINPNIPSTSAVPHTSVDDNDEEPFTGQ